MEWLLALIYNWWWLIALLPVVAVIVVIIVAFAGSKGPYPKINVFKEEKTFVDAKTGSSMLNSKIESHLSEHTFVIKQLQAKSFYSNDANVKYYNKFIAKT